MKISKRWLREGCSWHMLKGFVQLILGKREQALECFDKVAQQDSTHSLSRYCLGRLHLVQGNTQAAIKLFNEALELCPRESQYIFWLGQTYSKLQAWDEVMVTANHVLSAYPTSVEAWLIKGRSFWEQEEYNRALHCYRQALIFAPDHEEALNQAGLCLYKLGDFHQGKQTFLKLVNKKHGDWEPNYNLALCLAQLEEYEEALDKFKLSQEKGCQLPDIDNNLAFCLAKLGHYQEALQLYERCAQTYSLDLDILCNKGLCLLALNRPGEALGCFEQALLEAPEDAELLRYKAICFTNMKRWDDAAKTFESGIATDPANTSLLVGLAETYLTLGRQEKALENFEAVVKADKHNRRAWLGMATIYEALNNPDEAIFCYNKAITLR